MNNGWFYLGTVVTILGAFFAWFSVHMFGKKASNRTETQTSTMLVWVSVLFGFLVMFEGICLILINMT